MRRLHHNTCIPRPAVRGLGGLGERKPQPGPCHTFLWPFYVYDSDVVCGESGEEGGVGGIRTHHRGIKQVNHNLFSLSFLAQSGGAVGMAVLVRSSLGPLVQHFGPF